MGKNIIKFGNETVLDLSSATVTEDKLAQGITAWNSKGDLITGTSSGGLPTGFSKIAKGEYTFTSDMASNSSTTSTTYQKTITHGLGVIPDMILFYTEANIAQTYSELGVMWGNSILNWRSSSYKSNCFYHGNSTTTVGGASCNTTYGIRNVTATQFSLKTHTSNSYYWRAGTYKWIAIKF